MLIKPIPAALLAAALYLPFTANALVIDVTGTAGSGTTAWNFSGSSVAGGNSGFCGSNCSGSLGSTLYDNTGWRDIGNFVNSTFNFSTVFAASSTASAAINGGTAQSIDRLYLDDDGASAFDDFGIGLAGTDLLFTTGDTISWTGQLIMNVDLNDLAPDGLPATFTSSNFDNTSLTGATSLGMTLNISPASASVPIPSTLALFGLGLAGLGWKSRKKA